MAKRRIAQNLRMPRHDAASLLVHRQCGGKVPLRRQLHKALAQLGQALVQGLHLSGGLGWRFALIGFFHA
jgi:hypothetical protein